MSRIVVVRVIARARLHESDIETTHAEVVVEDHIVGLAADGTRFEGIAANDGAKRVRDVFVCVGCLEVRGAEERRSAAGAGALVVEKDARKSCSKVTTATPSSVAPWPVETLS